MALLRHAVAATLARGPSVLLLFGFEYVILASGLVAGAAKYALHVADAWQEGRWEHKGLCLFYLELASDVLHFVTYLAFFVIVFAYYGLPLHMARAPLGEGRGRERERERDIFVAARERSEDGAQEVA